jgi:hypothetical protein
MAKNLQKIGQKSTKSRFHHNLVNWGVFNGVRIQFFLMESDKVPQEMASPKGVQIFPNCLLTKNGQKSPQNGPNMAKSENFS